MFRFLNIYPIFKAGMFFHFLECESVWLGESWKLEVGSWELGVGSWELEVGSWELELITEFSL